MKTKLITTILTTVIAISGLTAFAGDIPADATVKQKLLGYWRSGRHDYLYKANGIRYMLPRPPCTTTSHWDVKGAVYFEGSKPCDIVALTKDKFAYCSRDMEHITFTLKRIKKPADQ